jgi:hypothetical protein
MKKTIISALLGIVSISAFAQTKDEKIKQPITSISDSLAIAKQQAIELYKLLEYCKEAVSTTTSKKITVADANAIMEGIAQVQKTITDRYQPKQPADPSTDTKPKQ